MSEENFNAGVHLVTIKDIRYDLKSKKELRTTKSGMCGVQFTFVDNNSRTIKTIFWLTEKSKWIFTNLCKAINVNVSTVDNLFLDNTLEKVQSKIQKINEVRWEKQKQDLAKRSFTSDDGDRTKVYKVLSEAIDKSLFIIVAEHYFLLHSERAMEIVVNPKGGFYSNIGNVSPAFDDEPSRNNGVYKGKFLLEDAYTNSEADNYSNSSNYHDDYSDDFWHCDVCGGSHLTGCLYFDVTECKY